MKQAPSVSWIDRLAAHPLLISALLFFLALALRLLAIGRYVTPDELIWVYRSLLFREAILARQWADTLVAGHPGVTTTWLGSAALTAQMLLRPSAREAYTWITQLAYLTPDNMAAYQQLYVFLNAARFAVAAANSAGVVAVFWLVRELLNGRIALIAALLLALDPFLGGISGLFHVDGLLATWSIISLLALALGVGLGRRPLDGKRRLAWLGLSAASAALAVLSKSPALILLPVAALAILSLLRREASVNFNRRLAMVLGYGIFWAGIFFLIIFLLYPALWSSPMAVLSTTGGNAGRHVEEALRPTFFMGDTAYDQGPLFYPVTLLWRGSPLVIGGLILLVLFLARRPRFRERDGLFILLLALWALLFLAAITIAAKKFDRYLLPVIPALAILAAIALAKKGGWRSRAAKAILLFLVAAQVVMLAASAPYLLSSYNPLAGGPLTAQYLLPLGWGEGVSTAGQWLAGMPEVESKAAVSGIAPSLAPFFPGTTLFWETTEPNAADYLILTANSRQTDPTAVARADQELERVHTVRFGLLDQAWVYLNPDPQPHAIDPQPLANPVSFDGQMALLASDLRSSAEGDEVLFTARWRKEQESPLLRLHLRVRDQDGHTWSELETDLLNDVYFYPQHWHAGESPQVTFRLALPLAMPPGVYTVDFSLIDQKSGGHLVALSNGQAGGVVYEIGDVQIDLAQQPPELAALPMTPLEGAAWLDGELVLAGFADFVPLVQSGGAVDLDLFWTAGERLPAGLQVALQLDGADAAIFPISSFDSGQWPPGTVLRQKYSYPVPADMESGDYELTVLLLDGEGEPLPGERVVPVAVEVQALDRLMELPDDIAVPLEIRFDPGIVLRGFSPHAITAVPGQNVYLTLYWQAEKPTSEPVSAFIHLLDEDGEIVAQTDQWPGGLPSSVWSAGQVIVDEHALAIPSDLAPGDYRVATGLYTAADGTRLHAFDSAGERLPDDRFYLPAAFMVAE
jgi:4-amino-4-deoxy-L-arabinose transferase-like glycosyltransferase